MKKSLLTLLGAGLLLTSCQSDEPFAPTEGGEKQVTFTLNVPGDLGTRAGDSGNNSGVGGFTNKQGNVSYTLVLSAEGHNQTYKKENVAGNTVTFSPTVILGREYTVTAYAHFSATAQEDLKNIAVTKDFNDESKDVYFFTTSERASDPTIDFATEGTDHTFTLKRPFGKLRLVATDYQATGNGNTAIKSVKVKYNNNVFTTFNAVSGEFSNGQSYEHTLDGTNYSTSYYAPEKDENGNVTGQTIFADYVPVNSTGVAPFTITVEYNSGETYTRSFSEDIPVKRNALTTLRGNFFTTGAEIKVEVKDAFEGFDEPINFVSVSTATQLQDAIDNGGNGETIILTDNINLNDLIGPNFAPTRAGNNDPSITIAAEKNLTIDLNGKKLSAISKQTGKNYNMIDVSGELTVKNGTIEYEHKGANMEWNNYAEIFHVGFGGTLNLEGVTANNRGGSAMAYVIDMTNGTDITVNVKNSTLKSTYIPVRVFNNNKNGVHNVAISNTTLEGKYCFWVQYWLADGRDQETLKRTLKLDIFDGTNTFEYTNDDKTPVLCGFNEYLNLDEDGYGTFGKTHYVYSANALIKLSENGLKAGETVLLCADIDLAGKDFNGLDTFHPENGTTFDGQGYTVSNWTNKIGASDMGFIKNWVGPIKNINFVNCHLKTSGRSAIVAAKVYGNIENVHVEDCSIEDSYWACGLIAGLYNAGSISDCSATNSSVKSNGGTAAIAGVVNESAGTRSFTNCKVEGCTINNTGAYGEAYSGALLCGMINISNSTVKFKGCTQKDNTKLGKYVGDLYYAADEDITIVVE